MTPYSGRGRTAAARRDRRLDTGGPRHHADQAMIDERVVQVLDTLGVPYELMQIDPAFAEGYLNRGNARERAGDRTAACADWGRAAELGHPDAAVHLTTCS